MCVCVYDLKWLAYDLIFSSAESAILNGRAKSRRVQVAFPVGKSRGLFVRLFVVGPLFGSARLGLIVVRHYD